MARAFSPKTQEQALARSEDMCEAEGALYGLVAGVRCGANLRGRRREFDHILAHSNGGDNSLENCAVVCGTCHDFKSHKLDTPRAAKTVRQRRKAKGIKRQSQPMPGSRASKFKRCMDGSVVRR